MTLPDPRGYLRRAYIVEPNPPADHQMPVLIPTTLHLGNLRLPISHRWKITGARDRGTLLHVFIPRELLTIEDSPCMVRIGGQPVLVPAFDEHDLPARLEEAGDWLDSRVEVALYLAEVVVGGSPPEDASGTEGAPSAPDGTASPEGTPT